VPLQPLRVSADKRRRADLLLRFSAAWAQMRGKLPDPFSRLSFDNTYSNRGMTTMTGLRLRQHRAWLTAALTGVGSVFIQCTAGYAQGTPAGEASASTSPLELETVTVTGSRIRRTNTYTDQPTQTIDAQAIEDRGYVNAIDAINNLPQMGTPESGRGDQGANVGRSYANLFNLGSQRTLTLVNGRRFVSSNPATAATLNSGSQVDLNNIPAGLIDRVEIVQATGAATYGSDAIAGVVNIILKNDLEGLQLDAQSGISERGDSFTYSVRATGGHMFADGRGNVALSYERTSNDGLVGNDRQFTAAEYAFARNPADRSRTDGVPGSILIHDRRVPEFTEGGVPFTVDSPALESMLTMPDPTNPAQRVRAQFGSDGTLVPYDVGTYYAPATASGGDGFNLANTVALIAPVQRDLLYATARYELSDTVRLSSELMVSRVEGEESANQAPTFNAPIFPGALAALPFSVDNPFLTDQARGILQSQGLSTFYLGRANRDLAHDVGLVRSRTGTERGVIALDGDFAWAGRSFYWNAAGNLGHSGGDVRTHGLRQQNFLYALDAVRAPDNSIVCNVTLQNPGSTDPAISGCRPLNLFGTGAPSAAAIDYIDVEVRQDFDLYQTNVQVNFGGDILALPAGNLSFSTGYEYRREKSSFEPNEVSRLGLSRDVPLVPMSASYHTSEIYGELSVPLLGADFKLPLVQSLTLDAAIRSADARAGTDEAWNLGARWNVVDDLTLRASKSRTFRGPSIVELFLPRSSLLVSTGSGSDPCDANNITLGANPSARLANCQALFRSLGLPENYALNSTGQTVAVPQTVGGNANLGNETADSWTAGLVVQPRWVPGLTLSADYVSISLEDAISSFNAASILSTCFDSSSPSADLCNLVTRDANAQITGVTGGYVNAGFTNMRGISYALDYRLPLSGPSQLSVALDVLQLRRLETSVSGLGFDLDRSAGDINAPKVKGQLAVRYYNGPLSVSWFTNYVGSAQFGVLFTQEDLDVLTVGEYFRHDLSAQYTFSDRYTVRAGVNNVLDEEPEPLAIGRAANLGSYDVIGRSYFLGVKATF
jgi:iron complex outermembrane recepter protein